MGIWENKKDLYFFTKTGCNIVASVYNNSYVKLNVRVVLFFEDKKIPNEIHIR